MLHYLDYVKCNRFNLKIKIFFKYFDYRIFETDEYYFTNKTTDSARNGTF